MLAFAFSFADSGSLIRPIRSTNDQNRQEDKDPNYVVMPEGENDEGKS
jgi:hypothetical protein